jgi:ATP-binding cassette subfamily B protein
MLISRRLVALVWSAPWHVAAVVAAGLGAVAASVALGLLVARVVGAVLAGAAPESQLGAVAAIAGVIALRFALLALRDLTAAWAGGVLRRRLRTRLYARLLELGPGHLVGGSQARVQSALVDGVEALQAYLGLYVPQAVVAVLGPAAIVAVIATRDVVVGAIVGIAVVAIPVTRPLWYRALGRRGRAHWDAYAELAGRFVEAIQGMGTLKAVGASRRFGRDLENRSALLYRTTMRQMAISLGHSSVVGFAMTAGTALAVGVGAWRLSAGQMTPADLLIVLFLTAEAFRPLNELQDFWHEGFLGLSAAGSIFALLDAEPGLDVEGSRRPGPSDAAASASPGQPVPADAAGTAGAAATPGAAPPTMGATVTLEGVWFGYPGAPEPALRDVSLRVGAGERVAIVGRTGAGKSTIGALLQRAFDPDRGRVSIGGTDLTQLSPEDARALVAVVAQDPYLFTGTVADNLRLADPDASMRRLHAAARAAALHDRIVALPDGYDSAIGERGLTLSGGERQRLAIARALLTDAPVLLLDEATSAVDADNETAIAEAIERAAGGRTIVTIAHRLSTIAAADRVAVIDRGCVVADGPMAELIADDGLLARLVDAERQMITGGAGR